MTLDPKEVPASVAEQVACGTDPDDVTRRPFAGGFVFAWKCASNHANWITALVYADTEDGGGARLLRFPGAKRSASPAEELSNVRWLPASREVSELFVDPENRRVCRHEARWRLTGDARKPELLFWRETRDCAGKGGWITRLDKRASGRATDQENGIASTTIMLDGPTSSTLSAVRM